MSLQQKCGNCQGMFPKGHIHFPCAQTGSDFFSKGVIRVQKKPIFISSTFLKCVRNHSYEFEFHSGDVYSISLKYLVLRSFDLIKVIPETRREP
jgi:hypothetical protein